MDSDDITGEARGRWFPEHLGPCRLIEPIGSGATATVFLAEMVRARPYAAVGARVAVKLLHPERLHVPGAFKRLLREARLGTSVRHPAVMRVYEVDADAIGARLHHFLVMELVPGQKLRDTLGQLRILPEALLRSVGAQVARGLSAIHAAGVIHRDLNPNNIVLTPDHQVKLVDFGIVCPVEDAESLTSSGVVLGTAPYVTPEQVRGESLTPACDLYSLGVLMHEAATGNNPFATGDARSTIARHVELTPPRIGELNPQVSPFLEEVVTWLLQKDPAARPSSALELAGILEAGEDSSWWKQREERLRSAGRRTLRRVRVRRDTTLQERDREIARMQAAWARAQEGEGAVCVIEGEAGSGKSRIVDEFMRLVEAGAAREGAPGAHVLYGAQAPSGAQGGLGAIGQALRMHLGDAALEIGLTRILGPASSLAPALAATILGIPTPAGHEPLTIEMAHAAVTAIAAGLARERPTAWFIDDLHLATAPERALVLALARTVVEQRLLVVITTRPGMPAEESAWLERLGQLERLRLARLSVAGVESLLLEALGSASLAASLAERIAAKSGGNPFFVLELVRDLEARSVLQRGQDGSFVIATHPDALTLPASVRDLLLARLEGLAEDDREILEVGAVQGDEIDPDLVARALERKRLDVLQSLARLERLTGVVHARGGAFELDHHELREVILERLPPILSAEIHGLLARCHVERRGLVPGEASGAPGVDALFVAEHALRAGDVALASPWLARAMAHAQATHRHELAAELARLALAADGVDGAARIAVALAATMSQELLLRWDEMLATSDAALAASRAIDDAAGGARALVAGGRALHRMRRHDEAKARLEEGVAAAAAGADDVTAITARTRLASLLLDLGDQASAREHLVPALERSTALGLVREEAGALGILALADQADGRFVEARRSLERSLELARAAGARWTEAVVLANLGRVLRALGEHGAALGVLDEQRRACRDVGYRLGECNGLGILGHVLAGTGRLPEAKDAFERQLGLARTIGASLQECVAEGSLALVARARGDVRAARAHADRNLALCLAAGDRPHEATARCRLGRLALDDGLLDEARAQLDAARTSAGEATAGTRAFVAHFAGDVARAAGALAEAERCYREAAATWNERGGVQERAEIAMALGRVLAEQGRHDEAITRIREADALVRAHGLAEPGVVASAWLARLGRADPSAIVIPDGAPAQIRREALGLLGRTG